MQEIQYKLGRHIFAELVKKEAVLLDTNANGIALSFACEKSDNERLVVTLRAYGTEVAYKQELEGLQMVIPSSLIAECKIVGTVEQVDNNGKILSSWVLEPLQLVSLANQETTLIKAIPAIEDTCELMQHQLAIYDAAIDKIIKSQATQQIAINNLLNRLKGCEDIILNPFVK